MNPPQPQMGIHVPNGPGPGMPQGNPIPQGVTVKIGPGGMPVVTRNTFGKVNRAPVAPAGPRPAGLGGSIPGRSMPGGFGNTLRSPHNSLNSRAQMGVSAQTGQPMDTGVRPGMNMMGGPSVRPPAMNGPSLQQIQAEMARRQVGAQLGPRNGALAGYLMGQ